MTQNSTHDPSEISDPNVSKSVSLDALFTPVTKLFPKTKSNGHWKTGCVLPRPEGLARGHSENPQILWTMGASWGWVLGADGWNLSMMESECEGVWDVWDLLSAGSLILHGEVAELRLHQRGRFHQHTTLSFQLFLSTSEMTLMWMSAALRYL